MTNLFLFVGQPEQGKTTLARWFRRVLRCPVVHTDDLYLNWIESVGIGKKANVRRIIMRHYRSLPEESKTAWNTYLDEYIRCLLSEEHLNVVVEGWLVGQLPKITIDEFETISSLLVVTMQRHQAHVDTSIFRPDGRDCTRMVVSLSQKLDLKKKDMLCACSDSYSFSQSSVVPDVSLTQVG